MAEHTDQRRPAWWPPSRWPEGVRASAPVALPTFGVGVSFGLLAAPLLSAVPTIVMSLLVWSGTAQFAAVSLLAGGSGAALATGTGLLANTRFLPMGFALAPSVQGRVSRRLLAGVLLADASFVIGNRGSGRFDVAAVVWAAPLQYVAWAVGTTTGVLGAGVIGDPGRFGLDVLFPVFYLSLLLPELRATPNQHDDKDAERRGTTAQVRLRPALVAGLAAALVVALTPVTPPGVPVVVAALTALVGLWPPRQRRIEGVGAA